MSDPHSITQALEADMVQYLLGLLEGRLEALENPAMTKAQIVKALKAMRRSLVHGDRVAAILNKSPVWSEYKDQRHDLFITSTHTAGYLTGNSWDSETFRLGMTFASCIW
jgi:DnaJ family protein C protein 13